MNQIAVTENSAGLVLDVKKGTVCRVDEDRCEIDLSEMTLHPKPESVKEGIIRRNYFSLSDLISDFKSLAKRCGLEVTMTNPAPRKFEFTFE